MGIRVGTIGQVLLYVNEDRFKLGQIVMTAGLHSDQEHDLQFAGEISRAFQRYTRGDWGDLCAEDKRQNDWAVASGEARILASYNTSKGKLWIITEWDRSVTTILYADEY